MSEENKIGIADNLIRNFSTYFPDQDLAVVLEQNMCQECLQKINNILAKQFVKNMATNKIG